MNMLEEAKNQLFNAESKLKKRMTFIALAYLGIVCTWDLFYPSRQVNYRLDVTFEVDGVPVTGSGVFQLTVWTQPELITFVSGGQETTGEAVTVELPNRSDLFVLMAVWDEEEWVSTSHASPRFDDLLYYACGVHDRWKRSA
ncbi:hypothetical protein FDK21_04880 [Cohaesibacter sp. CAU 1516]|nr:hypothetical protein FDK21_04880 [Cohaesibacter sp. CAU 1516]